MASLINRESNVKLQNIIDEYPDDILSKIFGFLNWTSLENLILVNKRWYDIIINDISLMKKLQINISGEMFRIHHLIVGNWKYHKVTFTSINKSFNTEMLSKLNEIGSNIREIEFLDCNVNKPKVFQNILKNFPKAENITFYRCFVTNRFNNWDTEVLILENLKELLFEYSSVEILCFIGAQLKCLKLNLHYSHKEGKEPTNEQQLMKFLKTQKDSIEILELGSKFSNDVYELILNKYENVKTLRISVYDFPADLKRIKINKNVTKLIIHGDVYNTDRYCTILSLFPNVTDISFSYYTYLEVLSWLPTFSNILTSLSLFKLRHGNYENIKFPALKSFHLEYFEGGSEWTDLVMCNPTIETLSLGCIEDECDFDPDELKMVLEVLPNLKRLKLYRNWIDKLYHFENIRISYY